MEIAGISLYNISNLLLSWLENTFYCCFQFLFTDNDIYAIVKKNVYVSAV